MTTEDKIREAKRYISRLADAISAAGLIIDNLIDDVIRKLKKAKPEEVDRIMRQFRDDLTAAIEHGTDAAIKIAGEKNGILIPATVTAAYFDAKRGDLSLPDRVSLYSYQLRQEVALTGSQQPNFKSEDVFAMARLIVGLKSKSNNATNNIKRLYSDHMARSFAFADNYMMGMRGAIGYIGFRNSTFHCPLCDSYCGRFIPITDLVFPVHIRCLCGMIPVFAGDIL